ncbi:MAG: molybdate ABC transporter substrate-binding protein [Deltaproteobacteria bacterium]|nr:molybdate ABC transporter substrate-binding protein [Deltaproteobacteria bacterium]
MEKLKYAAALILLLIFGVTATGRAETLTVAVAANFTAPMRVIIPIFKRQTGVVILPSYGGTGTLYALIKNGAPFDLFLAADQRRPNLLYQEHLADKPRIYAKGQAVLWTAKKGLAGAADWRAALRLPGMKRIAIANPRLAPYGAAVMAVLSPSLKAALTNRLIYAENVSQAFQYAQMAADGGFTALSFALSTAGKHGSYWPISEAPLVRQSACIIKNTPNRQAAARFFSFLFAAESKAVLTKFGYK